MASPLYSDSFNFVFAKAADLALLHLHDAFCNNSAMKRATYLGIAFDRPL
jgi:hypothetical protein